MNSQFPRGFVWGTASSAFQIEGAPDRDGKGESIWDRFTHVAGAIRDGSTADVACESYFRYLEDVELIRRLNLKSYRFSLSWTRIQPTGRGPPNQRGLDYYCKLLDALNDAGIRPLVTLYHWDLPQAIEDDGGWPSRDTAGRLADYAGIVARRLADRVRHWTIVNEPKAFTTLGYWSGAHAPGKRDMYAYLRATHTVNLAQGMAFQAMKAERADMEIGAALDVAPMYPQYERPEDYAAVERWHKFQNLWFVEPALTGKYPVGSLDPRREVELLDWRAGDERLVRAQFDFIGLNHYTPVTVRHSQGGCGGIPGLDLEAQWALGPGKNPKTDSGWDIYPNGFYDILVRMYRDTGTVPIEITENGAAFNVKPDSAEKVADVQRIDYLRGYLKELHRAIADGVNVRAYHYWSLLDNFEWAEGFSQRFGLVYADPLEPGRRIVKDSGHWYANVARTNVVS